MVINLSSSDKHHKIQRMWQKEDDRISLFNVFSFPILISIRKFIKFTCNFLFHLIVVDLDRLINKIHSHNYTINENIA